MRVAIVASHPIQYQVPLFRALARAVDLEVFFCHRQDAAGQAAAGFGVNFEWDVPLLDGYQYHWLQNESAEPDVSSFGGCDTPEIAGRLTKANEVTAAFDACIVSGWYLKSYLQTIWACKRTGTPLLCRGDSQLGTERSTLWSLAKHLPYRWLLSTIDAHLYVGHANRKYLEHYGVPDDCLFFAPHFVDNAFFAHAASRHAQEAARIRAAQQWPYDAVVFAFVGKLVTRKRPADFVAAIEAARRSDRRIVGLVAGAGALEPELRTMATQRELPILFVGFQNQSELPRLYAAADALVLPSEASETWGLVVNEAMACGRPAIVSDACGCARDLIDENETGHTFPMGDITALSERMLGVSRAGAAARGRMADAARAKAARYSCDTAVAGTLEALHAVGHANAAHRSCRTRNTWTTGPLSR